MDPPSLRSRNPPRPTSSPSPTPRPLSTSRTRAFAFGILDLVRVLGGVVLVSCTLSYLVTGNKSLVWNLTVRPERVRAWIRGPLHLTPAELLLHDGRSFPSVPIYLALNGTIYDVSASPDFYGPGGSYHFFAGRDATRAFVTGCFDDDLTGDLRGVERMFIPVDDEDDVARGESREQRRARKVRREREVREARRKVWEAVEGWRKMFDGGKGGKYFRVGYLVNRDEGWGEEVPPLCAKAEKARPKRVEGG